MPACPCSSRCCGSLWRVHRVDPSGSRDRIFWWENCFQQNAKSGVCLAGGEKVRQKAHFPPLFFHAELVHRLSSPNGSHPSEPLIWEKKFSLPHAICQLDGCHALPLVRRSLSPPLPPVPSRRRFSTCMQTSSFLHHLLSDPPPSPEWWSPSPPMLKY